jgi:hypothetical protein
MVIKPFWDNHVFDWLKREASNDVSCFVFLKHWAETNKMDSLLANSPSQEFFDFFSLSMETAGTPVFKNKSSSQLTLADESPMISMNMAGNLPEQEDPLSLFNVHQGSLFTTSCVNENELHSMLFGDEMPDFSNDSASLPLGTPSLANDASPASSFIASPQMDPLMLLNLSQLSMYSPLLNSMPAPNLEMDLLPQMSQSPYISAKQRSSPYEKPKNRSQLGINFIETTFTPELRTTQFDESGSKAFKCPHNDCDRSFVQMRALLNHQLSHSKDRLYSCQYCDARFRRQPDLQRHIRSLHTTGINAYVCPHNCGRSFPRSDALKRHLEYKPKTNRFACMALQAQHEKPQ